jgi:hypothetical protein
VFEYQRSESLGFLMCCEANALRRIVSRERCRMNLG